MSLKYKVIFILAGVFILYALAEYGIQRFLIFPSFLSLEKDEAVKDSQRAVRSIEREIEHIDSTCHDWAAWDDTYEFVESGSEEYIESNLAVSVFEINYLNLIYIFDNDGKVVWGEAHDLETGERIEVTEFSGEALPKSHPLMIYEKENDDLSDLNVSGLFLTEQGPILISSRPILTSKNEGPIRGSIIMGRFLNEDVVEMLKEQTQVDFRVSSLQADHKSQEFIKITGQITRQAPHFLNIINDEVLKVYTTFPDIQGNTALLLESKLIRKIAEKGYYTIRFATYSVLAVGFGVIMIMLLVINLIVLKPITCLKDHILNVGRTSDLLSRLALQRGDEIGTLANEFDGMLVQLSDARKKLLEKSYYSGIAEMASGILHNARNILTPMVSKIISLAEKMESVPLGNIQKALAELNDQDLHPEREKALNRYLRLGSSQMADLIQNAGGGLRAIMHHVAQIEKILAEQDRFSYSERAVEKLYLTDIIQDASALMPQEYQERISIDIDTSLSEMPAVYAERILLVQVFNNLLNNAAESILMSGVPEGLISLDGEVKKHDSEQAIHISIKDNGEGIDIDDIDRIFNRGFSSKGAGHSGIGLHWCSNILISMGGKIYAESAGKGKGACFNFEIPIQQDGNNR